MLVGWVCRAPAPLRRANVRGARPCPLPLALPLPARPFGAEWCPAFGPCVFVRGPALPRSPRAPLPLYVSVCVCGCVQRFCFVVVGSVAVLGSPRSSSVLRALARMPDAARCAPLPVPVPPLPSLSVVGARRCPSWAPCGRSALNGHSARSLSLPRRL